MHGRFIAPLAAGLVLTGCVQATRHSNTMVFGTNTSFGIRAGQSAASVPEVNIGYSRQEAVIMPLVANNADNGKVQSPCDPSKAVEVKGGAPFAVHPCLLVGTNDKAQDSYSVLASFGGKFGANADETGAKTEAGVAQYFATGIAAQLLAFQGGASLVAGGEAAKKAAETKSSDADIVSALYGGEPKFTRNVTVRKTYDAFEDRLAAKIQLTKPENLTERITKFETDTATNGIGIASECTTIEACISALRDNEPYLHRYDGNEQKFEDALKAWVTDL